MTRDLLPVPSSGTCPPILPPKFPLQGARLGSGSGGQEQLHATRQHSGAQRQRCPSSSKAKGPGSLVLLLHYFPLKRALLPRKLLVYGGVGEKALKKALTGKEL